MTRLAQTQMKVAFTFRMATKTGQKKNQKQIVGLLMKLKLKLNNEKKFKEKEIFFISEHHRPITHTFSPF